MVSADLPQPAYAEADYAAYLQKRRQTGLLRSLPLTWDPPGDRPNGCVDFVSSDYLDWSSHPELVAAAQAAASQYGVGATASRLLVNDCPLLDALESRIAASYRLPAALVLPSGYQTNASILSALWDPTVCREAPLVFFDKYNHASLYRAVRMCPTVRLHRYRHGDIEHLREKMRKTAHVRAPRFIVTETLFSMDGDAMDPFELAALASQYGACLYLDEAHAVGVWGYNGYGYSAAVDWSCVDFPVLIMGTFSKALGGFGGYVACSALLREYCVNRCEPLIYGTALPPTVVAAAYAAWEKLPASEPLRAQLRAKAAYVRGTLAHAARYHIGRSCSHIVPIFSAESDKTGAQIAALHQRLSARHFRVALIRPPSVPSGSTRLRIAVRAGHDWEVLQALCEVVCDA